MKIRGLVNFERDLDTYGWLDIILPILIGLLILSIILGFNQ